LRYGSRNYIIVIVLVVRERVRLREALRLINRTVNMIAQKLRHIAESQ